MRVKLVRVEVEMGVNRGDERSKGKFYLLALSNQHDIFLKFIPIVTFEFNFLDFESRIIFILANGALFDTHVRTA